MTRFTLSLLLIVAIKFHGSSQDFIDKNHFSVELEGALAIPTLNGLFSSLSFSSNYIMRPSYERSFFPPNVGLNIAYTMSDRMRGILRFSWKGLQNTEFYYSSRDFNYESNGKTTIQSFTDSMALSSNALHATIGFKYYIREVPNGWYVEVNGGYSEVSSKVYPTYYNSVVTLYYDDDINVTEKGTPGLYKNGFVRTSFGFGGTIVLPKKMFVDVGARISYYYGKYYLFNSLDKGTETISENRENLETYIKFSQLSNLQSSYLFETHVGFGIFF